MKFSNAVALITLWQFLVSIPLVSSLAPLEPPDGTGKIYLGAWYDRLMGDSPASINARLAYKPLSFFQMDINITQTLQSAEIDSFVAAVQNTSSTAFLFLTIYPYEGLDVVSDTALAELVQKIKTIISTGQKMLIRYGSEMNGSWFIYGQAPTAYIASWKRVVGAIRNGTNNSANVAFLWSPNAGSGYPYSGYGILPLNRPFDSALDTNGNGKLDNEDDPYSPYYPGDDWVDWVGMSIYHYSNSYPYHSNDVPPPYKFESLLSGGSALNFYKMFSETPSDATSSATLGGKPFFVSETGSTVHVEIVDKAGVWSSVANTDAAARANIKRAWWRQFLNKQLLAKYPKLKGVSFFEFTKKEDDTIRDFTNLGRGYAYITPLKQDAGLLDNATLAAFQADVRGDIGNLILWASNGSTSSGTVSGITTATTTPAPQGGQVGMGTMSAMSLILLLFGSLYFV